jgi:hypothetical protein
LSSFHRTTHMTTLMETLVVEKQVTVPQRRSQRIAKQEAKQRSDPPDDDGDDGDDGNDGNDGDDDDDEKGDKDDEKGKAKGKDDEKVDDKAEWILDTYKFTAAKGLQFHVMRKNDKQGKWLYKSQVKTKYPDLMDMVRYFEAGENQHTQNASCSF